MTQAITESIKCQGCFKELSKKDLSENLMVCPYCEHHFRISARKRLYLLTDKESFCEINAELLSSDPLNFIDTKSYKNRYTEATTKTRLNDAIITGTALIEGKEVAIGIMDFNFMGGSMGSVVGEKVVRLIELAMDKKLPLILCSASGGARMQEGMISLMQMAKCSAAIKLLHVAGQLYISVLTDPTTGGVSASFAALGDINITEPNSTIGFAGRRVVEQTMKKTLPKDFQTADFVFKHGNVDLIVSRNKLKVTIAQILSLQLERKTEPLMATTASKENQNPFSKGGLGGFVKENLQPLAFEKPFEELDAYIKKFKAYVEKNNYVKVSQEEIQAYEEKAKQLRHELYFNLSPEQKVQMSRHPARPTTLDYINTLCSEFLELHGDRQGCEDKAIVGGIGRLFNGFSAVLIGHQKGNAQRNFGMPVPGGYRKALRLMYYAEKFGLPIITFLDTFGAYPGMESEEENLAGTIALCLKEMSALKIPTISIVIGQGGSGGALAFGVTNKIFMLENAYYSVIAPEGCAAIIWRDSKKADAAAKILKLTAQDLKKLEIIDEIIKEPLGGAHREPEIVFEDLKNKLDKTLCELVNISKTSLVKKRYQKFRKIGHWVVNIS